MGLHSLEVEKPYKCSIIIKNTGRYSNMMSEEKRRICDNIFDYISKELDNWIDNQIFIKSSMEELGELYYNHILDKVEDADTELLNAVIRTIKPRNIVEANPSLLLRTFHIPPSCSGHRVVLLPGH